MSMLMASFSIVKQKSRQEGACCRNVLTSPENSYIRGYPVETENSIYPKKKEEDIT
jgi:hypothetical protein